MLKLSEVTIKNLKRRRKYLLSRFADTAPFSPMHKEYGEQADLVGYELNRRTGETKYKL